MRQLAFLEGQGERFEKQIEQHIYPFERAAELLVTVPGIDRTAGCALIAERGKVTEGIAGSKG